MQGGRLLTGLLLLAVAATGAIVVAAGMTWPRGTLPPREGPTVAQVRSWGYQLQRFDARTVPDDVDLLVVDYSRDGSDAKALTPEVIERLRQRRGRQPRIVLCYMSIGEAENYRYYWRSRWQAAAPEWLAGENLEWKGNYAVRYWLDGWRRRIVDPAPTLAERVHEIVVPARRPYIDRIVEAGFDGVYLDRVDVFAQWLKQRASAPSDMVAFVKEIAEYARRRKPGFLVIAQNGEELLKSQAYVRALDGVAKEDLLFGLDGDGKENAAEDVQASVALLAKAHAAGLPVLVVEYVSELETRARAAAQLRARGFLPLFASRGLVLPPESVGVPGAGGAGNPGGGAPAASR